jgi:TetR/AcrR family transcriptional regulator, mexJK operon transcriptional repressor
MPRAKRVRADVKRAELLKVATELFLAKGYDGVSVDSIIARTGGTKSNVYKFFGSKAELFAEVVEEICRQIVHSFAGLEFDTANPEETLREVGRRFLGALLTKRSIRQHRMVVAESARFPSIGKRWFKAGPEGARAPLASYFEKLQKAGKLGKVPPRRLAGVFLDMLSEEQLLRQLIAGAPEPSSREINKLVDEVVTVFLHGALK